MMHWGNDPLPQRYRCLFCLHLFYTLPFYGCCGGCYAGSAEIRAQVDDAHPQTPQRYELSDIAGGDEVVE